MTSCKESDLSDFRSAAEAVKSVLLAALPPGVPPSFLDLVSAKFEGAGRKRKAVAQLVMFDGLLATVEVFVGGQFLDCTAWGHCWTDMPGGACSYENGAWVRCDQDGNILPAQRAFEFQLSTASGARALATTES